MDCDTVLAKSSISAVTAKPLLHVQLVKFVFVYVCISENCVSARPHNHSFSIRLSQNQEVEELTKICDELIAKLGPD